MRETDRTATRLREFSVNVPEAALGRIQSRLALSEVGYAPSGAGPWQHGTSAAYLREFLDYWRQHYDWRAAEHRLNRWPQFTATVQGLDLHFYWVRGHGSARPPILLTHGWPGSVVEFLDVIERLAYPERYDGRAEDSFDVVVPSLPGYGFSARPAAPIGPRRVAGLWRDLMVDCLGYPEFFAQGGDWGAAVTCWLGADYAAAVRAIHVNLFLGALADDHTAEAETWRRRIADVRVRESGYAHAQTTFPQTVGLALADNPLGFAAWVLEKFQRWGDTEGDLERRFSKDTLLTNIMLYLVNDAVISSLWMYYGADQEAARYVSPVSVPSAVALFPGEFLPIPPRSVVARILNLQRWTPMRAGGHFAALEEPAAFADDVRGFFTNLHPST